MEYGASVKHLMVEIYLFELKVSLHPHITDIIHVSFSRATTIGRNNIFHYTKLIINININIGTAIQKIKELFNIPVNDECRLWQKMKNSYDLLNNIDWTLSDAGIYGGQVLRYMRLYNFIHSSRC